MYHILARMCFGLSVMTFSVLCFENDANVTDLINLFHCQKYCENVAGSEGHEGDFEKPGCPNSNCVNCMDPTSSYDIVEISPNVNTTIQMNRPQLLCRESNSLTFRWNEVSKAIGYIVEVRRKDSIWMPALSSACSTVTLYDLNPVTPYKIRVRIVDKNRELLNPVESSNWVTTLQSDAKPLPISHMWIDNVVNSTSSCNVTLKWSPAEDLSCAYDFVKFVGDEFEQIEVREPQELFEIQIKDVPFGAKVNIMGRAVSLVTRNESDDIHYNFTAPSCLDVHKNLALCPPPMPHVLEIKESLIDVNDFTPEENNFYNVSITWEEPALLPDYYIVKISCPKANNFNRTVNVLSDATHVVLTEVVLNTDYKVTVTAVSRGGNSPLYIAIRTLSPVPTYSNHNEPFTYVIFLGILGFFVLTMSVLFIYFFVSYRRAKLYREKCREKYFKELDETTNKCADIIVNELDQTEFQDNYELKGEIFLNVVLGEGAFGVVRRGWLQRDGHERKEVAIKMLKDEPTIEEVRQIRQEIEIMKSVGQHPHLVSLICCCTHAGSNGPKTPLLVVEYCACGDLQTYLRAAWDIIINLGSRVPHAVDESTGVVVNQLYEGQINIQEYHVQPKDLLSFGRQIVLGMEYLSKLRVVHRDLAARNVLVCEDGITVKVADFGLSRDIYRDNVYYKKGNGKLPMKWMALESLTHRWYTTQSDVWSFGVLMWEIVTLGGNPYPNVNTKDFVQKLENGYRMEKPVTCSDEVYKIMLSCWEPVPSDRPTFTSLKKILEDLLETETHYIHVDTTSYYKISGCRSPSPNSTSSDGSYQCIRPF